MAITRFGRGEMLAGTALPAPSGAYNYYLQAVSLTDATGADVGTAGNPLVVTGSASGSNQVVGNVASGATDSGNPVKVGALVGAPGLTLRTAGQRSDLITDPYGNLRTRLVGQNVAASDGLANTSYDLTLHEAGGTSGGLLGVGPSLFNGTGWDRARGDTIGAYVVSKGSASVATAQVSVTTAATQIVAARAGRTAVTIKNAGTTDVFVGIAGVTTTTGILLEGTKGASITIPTSAAIFGIVGTGSQSVSVLETY